MIICGNMTYSISIESGSKICVSRLQNERFQTTHGGLRMQFLVCFLNRKHFCVLFMKSVRLPAEPIIPWIYSDAKPDFSIGSKPLSPVILTLSGAESFILSPLSGLWQN